MFLQWFQLVPKRPICWCPWSMTARWEADVHWHWQWLECICLHRCCKTTPSAQLKDLEAIWQIIWFKTQPLLRKVTERLLTFTTPCIFELTIWDNTKYLEHNKQELLVKKSINTYGSSKLKLRPLQPFVGLAATNAISTPTSTTALALQKYTTH